MPTSKMFQQSRKKWTLDKNDHLCMCIGVNLDLYLQAKTEGSQHGRGGLCVKGALKYNKFTGSVSNKSTFMPHSQGCHMSDLDLDIDPLMRQICKEIDITHMTSFSLLLLLNLLMEKKKWIYVHR